MAVIVNFSKPIGRRIDVTFGPAEHVELSFRRVKIGRDTILRHADGGWHVPAANDSYQEMTIEAPTEGSLEAHFEEVLSRKLLSHIQQAESIRVYAGNIWGDDDNWFASEDEDERALVEERSGDLYGKLTVRSR